MTSWADRSPVVAAMLNPALLATVTAAAAKITEPPTTRCHGLWPSSSRHSRCTVTPARRCRNGRRRTEGEVGVGQPRTHGWVPSAGPDSLTGPTEGIRFGLAQGALVVVDGGSLRGGLARAARPARVGDIAEVIRASGFVGKWLTKLDQPATAFALLGVTP